MTISRALYRGRQFAKAASPGLDRLEQVAVRDHLNEKQQAVFFGMSRRVQRHAFDVYSSLVSQGHTEPPLLTAALLHDAGNGTASALEKTAFVLLEALAPKLLSRLRSKPRGWLPGLQRGLHHAKLGADIAQETGATALTVWLIREHHSRKPADPRLIALQRADEAS